MSGEEETNYSKDRIVLWFKNVHSISLFRLPILQLSDRTNAEGVQRAAGAAREACPYPRQGQEGGAHR